MATSQAPPRWLPFVVLGVGLLARPGGQLAFLLAFALDADLVDGVHLEDVERTGHLADLVGAG